MNKYKYLIFIVLFLLSIIIAWNGGCARVVEVKPTAAPDTVAPTIVSISPASGSTDIVLNTAVSVSFSETMDASSISTSTFTLSSAAGQVAGIVNYDSSSKSATFTPSANLIASTTYTASISATVKDIAGNQLGTAYGWTFTTGSSVDTTAPTVQTVTPSNGATGVYLNASIAAVFSKAMNISTINNLTFTLSSSSGMVSGSVSYNSSSMSATFTPSANLLTSTTYTASISAAVKDTTGNQMASSYSWSFTTAAGASHSLRKLFFLHHSVGDGLIVEGDMRGYINSYNSSHGTIFAFWDHGYNADGLRNPSGESTGTDYAIPGDNTNPDGLHDLFTSSSADWLATRTQIMSYEVIALKSCFPNSAIPDTATLDQYKNWYLDMRNFFDLHPEKLFAVISTPPLISAATNSTEASNARAFANWLKSSTYLSGHPNVVCFDLFDNLAKADDGSAGANMLRSAYCGSDPSDSHPNSYANSIVGPVFAQFLIDSALNY